MFPGPRCVLREGSRPAPHLVSRGWALRAASGLLPPTPCAAVWSARWPPQAGCLKFDKFQTFGELQEKYKEFLYTFHSDSPNVNTCHICFICQLLSLSLPLTRHTRTHTYAHTRAHTHTCSHACTRMHMHTCTHAHICTHVLTRTHMHTCTHTHTYARMHIHTGTHTCTHACTRAHTHTYAHTHAHARTYTRMHTLAHAHA